MPGKTSLIRPMLLRDLYRHGDIVSVTNYAVQKLIERSYLWQLIRKLEVEGLVIVERKGTHPAIVKKNPNHKPAEPCGMYYQLALWK